MDLPQINFNEYKFDPAPYIVPVNTLSQQIQDKNFEVGPDSKTKIKQLDILINEKMEECSQIGETIKNVRTENLKMQMELKSLKKAEERLSNAHLDLKEVLKNMCKVTFVQNNEEFRTLTQKIQMSLGFKLKLQQCHSSFWIATFLFDVSSELESNHCVVIAFNTQDESFTLRDIKPKPARFTEMVNFLAKTNDVTGLLYNCWKYFSLTSSQH